MQIKTEEVMTGIHDGKEVWICHYLHPDPMKKARRIVRPQGVLIRPIKDLPPNKRVYYSQSFFSPLSIKTGNILEKVISPLDNSGHRARSGVPLHVFDNRLECIESWKKQVQDCLDSLTLWEESLRKDIETRKEATERLLNITA